MLIPITYPPGLEHSSIDMELVVSQGLLEVCPSKPGPFAAATVSCAGTALQPCRPSLLNPPLLAT